MSRRAEGERCEALHKSDLEPWTWRDVARTGITVLIAAVAVALATVAGATGTGDGSASARGAFDDAISAPSTPCATSCTAM